MKTMIFAKKAMIGLSIIGLSVCALAYRSTSMSTEPNVWSRNYSGVLAAAKQTGYPILIVIVNSATCGHCHLLNQLTLNSAAFATMERELTFYKLMMDAPNGGEFQTTVSRYYNYFNGGMYPIIGVLKKDGSMYGAFGNRTTDGRDVTPDIRKMIEQLARDQGADIWSASGVTPAAPTPPPEPTAQEWAAKLKGKASGILLDANQNMVGTIIANISARGKAMMKISTRTGTQNVRGEIAVANKKPQVKSDDLTLTYDSKAGTWSGTWGDLTVLASAATPKGYDGLYTAQATTADGTKAGFLTVTVNKTGKGKATGLLNGKNRVSAGGNAAVLPAALLAAHLPAWEFASDAAFVPVIKRGSFAGGVAIAKDGTVVGRISGFGGNWEATGARFTASNLKSLAGKMLTIWLPSGAIEVAVNAKGNNQIAAGVNDYNARVSAMARKGTFKGNAKINGARLSFEGALIAEGNDVRGAGVSYGAAGAHAVSIGAASARDGTFEK